MGESNVRYGVCLQWVPSATSSHPGYRVSRCTLPESTTGFQTLKSKIMKEIRICHPKICYFGLRIILSWKQVRNSSHRRSSLFSLYMPKNQGMNFLFVKEVFLCKGVFLPPLPVQEEECNIQLFTPDLVLRWVCINNPYLPLDSPVCFLLTHLPTIHLLEAQTPLFFWLVTVTSPQFITLC